MNERAFTRELAKLFGTGRAEIEVGIGDDAAVLALRGGRAVVTCDPVVAGVHFEPDTPLEQVGRKAVLRNLSDLAAMAATPAFLIASVLLPSCVDGERRDALFAGLRSASAEYGCEVVGGDVGTTPGPLTVTVTAIGELEGRALLRSGAMVGDRLFVTGSLGGAIAGRHLEPRPRIETARWLAAQSEVHAAIDISDGLALDLWTMLEASECPGAILWADAVPVHVEATSLESALHDGEDYELLISAAPGLNLDMAPDVASTNRCAIGSIVAEPGLWLQRSDGKRARIPARGYQHGI